MPSNEDMDANYEPAPEPEPAPAPTTPTFALGDVKSMIKEAVGEVLSGVMQRPTSTPQEAPEPPEPTDEEYRDNPRAATDKAVARAQHKMQKEMAQFRNFGLARLSELTENSMRSQLPYFTLYEGEIKGELDRLDPALRTDPQTIRLVHDSISMRHENERLEAARNEGTRRARGDAPAPTFNTSRGKPAPAGVATPAELGLGPDQIDEIERQGGPDAFAQRISGGRFADWKAYAEANERMRTAPKNRGRAVIPFARMEAKKAASR